MEDLDKHIASVDEMVEDEKKIVTYKLLSQQLALPIDQAKEILEFYAKSYENGKLSVIYSLTGKTHKGVSVTVVRDVNLEKAKSRLETIFSCFPYSVQKAKLRDVAPLYTTDYDMIKIAPYQSASFSSIRFNGSKKLSDDEIREKQKSAMLHTDSLQTSSGKPKTSGKPATSLKADKMFSAKKKSPSIFGSKSLQKESSESTLKTSTSGSLSLITDEASKQTTPAINGKAKNLKPSSIDTFISKDPPTKESDNNTDAKAKNTVASKTRKEPSSKTTRMQAFMTKGKQNLFEKSELSAKASTPSDPDTVADTPDQEDPEMKQTASDDELTDLMETVDTAQAPLKEGKKSVKKKTPPKKSSLRKTRPNSRELPVKKRRRIVQSSSSEESEQEEEFDQVDVIPPSPVPTPVVKKKVGTLNPRKKRVMKTKTYTDEEGYMVTKKEWEEVSCSSGDEGVVADKAKENKTPPDSKQKSFFAKKAATNKKQSSLMGYFVKKT